MTWLPTPKLNKTFETIKKRLPGSPGRRSGKPKIYYATQVAVNPVTLLMFINRPNLFTESHQRFIIGRLREFLPVAEVPIRLLMRPHRQSSARVSHTVKRKF